MSPQFQRNAPRAIAFLVAFATLTGLAVPGCYARETPAWLLQAVVQDWVSLVVVAPVLLVAGELVERGVRSAGLVLAGAYAYVAYTYLLYAIGVHFNALFLVYCALVGLPVFALLGLLPSMSAKPDRQAANALLVVVATFAVLWLGVLLPALWRGRPPAAIVETGLPSNPVHVLDLALVLPAMTLAAVRSRHGDRRAAAWVWIWLAFAGLMLVAIVAMLAVPSTPVP